MAVFDDEDNFQCLKAAIVDITARKRAEDELLRRTNDFIDSVKELDCTFAISRLVEDHNVSLEAILQSAVGIIPFAFRRPEIMCSRILADNRTYATDNYTDTALKQSSDIVVDGRKMGVLEVCRLTDDQSDTRNVIFNEKKRMISAIAGRLGRVIERKRAEDALRHRDAIIDAVSFAAEMALGDKFREGSLTKLLERFGRAMDVSRVYIFENNEIKDGTILTTQQHEWVAPGIESQMSNPDTINFNWYGTGWADGRI